MPNPRKPAVVMELNGAWKKNPQRRRTEPEAKGPVAKKTWKPKGDLTLDRCYERIVSLAHPGTLTDADQPIIEMAAELYYRLVGHRQGLDVVPLAAAEMGRLQAILGLLGMTPADRSKLALPDKKDPQEGFAKFKVGS